MGADKAGRSDDAVRQVGGWLAHRTKCLVGLSPARLGAEMGRQQAQAQADHKLVLLLVSSPMESVTGIEMAKELTSLGCLGIVNRFDSSLREIITDKKNGDSIRAVSVALNTGSSTINELSEAG